MRLYLRISLALAAAALCLCLLLLRPEHTDAARPRAAGAQPARVYAEPGSILFPELSQVTALSVSTPERSFHFHLDPQGAVRVNGRQADHEIFSTLLNQIRELPAQQHSVFSPSAQDLVLTLVVSTGSQQQTARFYSGGSDSKNTRIILDGGEAPQYRQTNGWRVGTLLMACEGTRILEADEQNTAMN